jgi:BirA family biotin operon repressor/biotin-[acetyl-CoA-carboxylase] ligase
MSAPSDLTDDRVQVLLRTVRYGRSLRVLPETDSTNDDARADAAAGAVDGHVVVADAQRRGRGSHGRTWASPAGTDLYLSIVARPERPLAQLAPLTLAVGLGVAEGVDAVLGDEALAPARVKWPNDVWLGAKKCAGILVEARAIAGPGDAAERAELVIGIGLNVNRLDFPEELAAGATSLRASRKGGKPLDRATVLAALLRHVERRVDHFVASGGEPLAAALEPRLALRGSRVRCDGREGTLVGVASSGALRLATDSGMVELISGRIEPLG